MTRQTQMGKNLVKAFVRGHFDYINMIATHSYHKLRTYIAEAIMAT